MNQFEQRINALRLQFKAERISIQKDANRAIGHISTDIGMVNTPEARAALRAERKRLYEEMLQAMRVNRQCYMQRLEELRGEYDTHLATHCSGRRQRRMMADLCRAAEQNGLSAVTIAFGANRRGTITFD